MKRKIIISNKEFTMPKMSIDTYTEYLDIAEQIDTHPRYTKQDIEIMEMFVCKAYGDQFTVEELKNPETGLDAAGLILEFQFIDAGIGEELTKRMEKIEKISEWQVIPEIEVTCSGKRYFINSITVEQYKKYVSLMEKNSTEKISGVMFFNTKIMQELFENELTLAEIGEIDAIDFLTAIKTVHFVMQNIIAEKLLNIVEVEQVEKEKSAFDEYDRENGYEDELEEPEENQWKVCGEIVDRVVKIAIRLLKNSYSQCMKENIVTLLEYLRFELDTINENQ